VRRALTPRSLTVRSIIPFALVAALCGPPGGAGRGTVPGAEWEVVPPASVGMDAAALERIAATAQAGKSNCLVVVRHGKIAGEWYFNGWTKDSTQNVFSVTKSLTSTLVGIAQDDGKLRLGAPASRWVPEWRGTPASAVTVRNLVGNDSGREWSPVLDYGDLSRATDRTQFAVDRAQTSEPGRVWVYNNTAIQSLQRVLRNATGQDPATYAKDRIFTPLGMTRTAMTRDGAGNAQMYAGLYSSCRDLARFGLLMLHRGTWGERRIVSSSWVARATGASSTPMNAAYGHLWWLNRHGVVHRDPLTPMTREQAADPATPRGRLVPGAPAGTYWAIGLGNQVVQVDPGSDTVVVRLGTAEFSPRPPTFGPAEASEVVTTAVTGK
jgi:CubicO group peptidase (beta-lactamase class C family)